MPSNHVILCCPFLLLPSIFASIRVFSNESVLCIRWPKYWVSASAWVLPMNIQNWFPLGWTGWISLQSKGLLRVFSSITVQEHQSFSAQPLWSSSHNHTWLLGKTIALIQWTFVGQVMSLLFNVLSRFVQGASFFYFQGKMWNGSNVVDIDQNKSFQCEESTDLYSWE